jgi:hypothetical protein
MIQKEMGARQTDEMKVMPSVCSGEVLPGKRESTKKTGGLLTLQDETTFHNSLATVFH